MTDKNCPMYLDRAVSRIKELEAENTKLKEHIKTQANQLCEGMCKEGDGGQGKFEDCQGCVIYAPLIKAQMGSKE
jgi:hypothetical protein